ncbi:hypothetical protein L218DRAFT_1015856 [Marasmius fiardii PR-910]|nr:hypothetical protein L218DRAFT_1015856 [Marasmius fiardii PR-910]
MGSNARCHCRFDFGASQRQFSGLSQSLYDEYTHCNRYPILHETVSIKADMKEAERLESVLSEGIVVLQSVIVSMKEEKLRIQREMGRYRSILRPIHRLPPELLGRIFIFTTEPSVPEDPFQTPSSVSFKQ